MKLYKITTQYNITKTGEERQKFIKHFFVNGTTREHALQKVAQKAFVELPNYKIENLEVSVISEIECTPMSNSMVSYID